MKILVLLVLAVIVASLGSALVFMVRDRGASSDRAVKALTVRIALSVALFAALMLAYYFGLITQKLQ